MRSGSTFHHIRRAFPLQLSICSTSNNSPTTDAILWSTNHPFGPEDSLEWNEEALESCDMERIRCWRKHLTLCIAFITWSQAQFIWDSKDYPPLVQHLSHSVQQVPLGTVGLPQDLGPCCECAPTSIVDLAMPTHPTKFEIVCCSVPQRNWKMKMPDNNSLISYNYTSPKCIWTVQLWYLQSISIN